MAYDLQIAAMTVAAEASGESIDGQRAVAHVLVNRLATKRWGTTLAMVCLYPYQFSSWNTKDPNRLRIAAFSDEDMKPYEAIVQAALDGSDPDNTGGALFYVNPSVASPSWEHGATVTATIGNHEFYKDVA